MNRTKFISSAASLASQISERRFYPGTVLASVAILLAGVACQKEHVRVVAVQNPEARRVGIGFIENRDIRYSPFSSKNFSDMLSFELMQSGYRLSDVDFAELRKAAGETDAKRGAETEEAADQAENVAEESGTESTPGAETDADATPAETAEAADSSETDSAAVDTGEADRDLAIDEESYADAILPEKSKGDVRDARDARDIGRRDIDPATINDGTRDLLPLRLRTIAGELQPLERVIDPEDRRLTGVEIARIASSNNLDYYIQGAIGRTETGLILETEQNTLVFLEVFDPQGERIGAINISVNDETLKRSSFLQQISAEIIEAFDREIGR
ncbi:MAG: lipoprotein [bacterium]|nr:lipoprotein [bacterium]